MCPVCRDVVHVSCGYIMRHGVTHFGKFELCSGSGTPYNVSIEDKCCT